MPTIFPKIIKGALRAHKVAENENHLAFLDINPLAKGHTLVIPKKETDYNFDVEDQEYMCLCKFANMAAKKIEAQIPCERIGVAVVGLEVAHVHIHLIPINEVEDINFARPKLNLTQDELALIAKKISD